MNLNIRDSREVRSVINYLGSYSAHCVSDAA